MALPPIRLNHVMPGKKSITRYQRHAIQRKLKPVCSGLKYCTNFDIVLTCGSCRKVFCQDCLNSRKRSIAQTYINTRGICNDDRFCGIHNEINPSEHMTDLDLYDHMASQYAATSCSGRCSRKDICPDCLIQLQTAYCVECVGKNKRTERDVPHYCSNCVSSNKYLYYINPEYLSDQTANPFAQKESENMIHHDYIYQSYDDPSRLISTVCGLHYNERNP